MSRVRAAAAGAVAAAARGEPGLPRLMTGRAFAQATWRHALFGWVLGRLA